MYTRVKVVSLGSEVCMIVKWRKNRTLTLVAARPLVDAHIEVSSMRYSTGLPSGISRGFT